MCLIFVFTFNVIQILFYCAMALNVVILTKHAGELKWSNIR